MEKNITLHPTLLEWMYKLVYEHFNEVCSNLSLDHIYLKIYESSDGVDELDGNEIVGSCEVSNITPFIFHSHPARLNPYPSWDDLITVARNNRIELSLIASTWGLWIITKNRREALDENKKSQVESCLDQLYWITREKTWERNLDQIFFKNLDQIFFKNLNQILNKIEKLIPLHLGLYSWSSLRSGNEFRELHLN